ncbi:MAG TPA: NAD-dependent succinate-semialdehyde dehydrogenase [Alphaproteobacteria bacterium]
MQLRDPKLLRDKSYVDGHWVGDGKTFAVTDKATGATLAKVADLDAAATRRAIEAAHRAFPAWRKKLAKERSAILRKWFELIMANQEDLAVLMTCEQGKPLTESRGEVAYGAAFVEWYAEEAKRVYGETIPQHQGDKRIVVLKEPVGVAAMIAPWNFPIAMITRKCAPALAAGCTAVIKPAEQTPLCALALAELAERAGMPPGVLNIVTTSNAAEVGREMTGNKLVRKLSFTGSTEVGRKLMAQCAPTIKKLSLELGGNAPFLVFDDADIDASVEGALASKYRNAGQTCVCANRILVQHKVYDEFAAKLSQAVSGFRVGNGLEQGVTIGPLIDSDAVAKVEEHIADALEKGARIVVGGKRHSLGGTFFEPTVLAEVTPEMKVSREETFGPVAPLYRFKNDEDAIRLANDTEFGLAAYFYSRDLGRVWRVAEALECGIVGVNTGLISTEVAPFGGVKESGIGREGSRHGIDEYLEIKYVCMGGI